MRGKLIITFKRNWGISANDKYPLSLARYVFSWKPKD